ncbi:cyclase family protein [Beijerinckia sp. L45]|uniref:cyclase family protein n=1 Tax=Beijerinckia sp. L45 TaxID=1641855 RepID=UPI00131BBFFD|nr:cyclase family protein [Beijerinckia sp. L45]
MIAFGALMAGLLPGLADPLPTPPAITLADAFALIASKPKVDLTHAFSPTTPVWEGFGQAKMTPAVDPTTLEAYTIAKDGFRATYYAMVGQYGTHVDPPAHFSATGVTMDQIPLDDMMLPMVVLDDTPFLASDPAHAFSVEDLLAWEKVHGRVPKGSFAALRTDLSKDWGDPKKFKRNPFPAWSLPVVKMLIEERGVTAIGHEAMDTDTTKEMASETYVLGSGHFQIEVMDNLDKVPPIGAYIVVTWPKVKNGLGFPARAYAVLP